MSTSKYIIGIDLGTTNCTMAYAAREQVASHDRPIITQFDIPQMISSGIQGSHSHLPSFVYFPMPEELSAKAAVVDWAPQRTFSLGIFARDRGPEVMGRLISSAKSWLCHDGIDRRESSLPLDADEESLKMSPVQAASEFLRHLKEAWNLQMPSELFEQQIILVTVPASFDPSARQLVQEASQMAGYPEIILLEEPQAAFYAWLHQNAESWRNTLQVGDKILVADIGGGTTDFSLITVEDDRGDLSLQRLAVGSHLLLGGDNMDLALTYFVKEKFESRGHSIEDKRLGTLVHTCRQGKELLLGENAPEMYTVTLQGKGSRLIGGSFSVEISKEEITRLLVDGFLPIVTPQERSPVDRRAGIQQVGLPYTKDPRMTCQMAKFLSLTGEADSEDMGRFMMPTAILYNGGVLKSAAIRHRLEKVLNEWAAILKQPPVKVLEGPDLDHAVSRGAVFYGLSREGKGIRIRGGTSRSYYVGVEGAAPAIPGIQPQLKALCVVPFGMEEGTEEHIDKQEFSLILGEQATFRFFCHSTPQLSDGRVPAVGDLLTNWQGELKELHPIETLMEKGPNDGKTIRVKLTSRVTELGVLELWCVAADGRKWKLEFDIRKE